MMSKASIRVLLSVLVATSVGVIVILAYFGIQTLNKVNSEWHLVYDVDMPMAHALEGISFAITDLRLQDQTILVDYDAAYLGKQLGDIAEARKAIDDRFPVWNAIPNKDPEAVAAFDKFYAEYKKWEAEHDEFVSLATKAAEDNDRTAHVAARDLSRGSLRDTRKVMEGELEATSKLVNAKLTEQMMQTVAIEKQAVTGFATVALVGIVVALVIAAVVLQSVRSSVLKGVAYAEAVQRGEYGAVIEHPGNEIGKLTRAIEKMKVSLVEKMLGMQELEGTLLESEERFRAVFEGAADGIFLLSSDGAVKFANAAMAAMHGYTIDEMLSLDLRDLDSPESARLAPARMKRLLAGEAMTFQVEHFCKNGRLIPVEVTANTVVVGQEEYVLAFHHDITERKRAEAKLAKSLSSIIGVVGQVVQTRDPYTAGHERRVSELATRIAEDMGMSAGQIDEIRVAALIHDVGKMSVPAEILCKPGELSQIEFELIKAHAESGYEILLSAEMEASIIDMVYQHHERCDGSGYPRGLTSDELLIGAKVLAVADVVEAMSSHRPYREALGIAPALAEIEWGSGQLYDAIIVESCLRVFREQGFVFSVV
jgi:PAS domain S-box-containing protein/putative nucleotidyltransferase with HDIG domain